MPNLRLMDLIFWIYHLHIPLSFSFSLIVCSLLTKLHFLSFLYHCPCCSFHLEHSPKLPASSQGWQSSPTYSSKPINSYLLVKLPWPSLVWGSVFKFPPLCYQYIRHLIPYNPSSWISGVHDEVKYDPWVRDPIFFCSCVTIFCYLFHLKTTIDNLHIPSPQIQRLTFLFLSVLLRYNWYAALCKFRCRVVSQVVGRGCLLWPTCSLGKTLLAFALLHFVLESQTCLLFQVSLWLPTFAFHSPMMKRVCFSGVSSRRSCRSS